ncbi:MAG: pseudouridine synthase [Chloroflexota bacterium]|nr:pseudouridine synthase [Chloroflexota bacterium]
MTTERLQKVMARAGIASRRACEEIIAAGRVSVNGRQVTEMGVKVDPRQDQIMVDGELLNAHGRPKLQHLMLYKPRGYLSVFNDDRGRAGLEALVDSDDRLFPVGRLDQDSEGLILLTNDGELSQRLSHPRYEHRKSYLVKVHRLPSTASMARLRKGIQLPDGLTAPSRWRLLEEAPSSYEDDDEDDDSVWLHVVLGEGRKRQIRRMAREENLRVLRLVRVGLGPLRLDRGLEPGDSRPLNATEKKILRTTVFTERRRPRSRASGSYPHHRRGRPRSRR